MVMRMHLVQRNGTRWIYVKPDTSLALEGSCCCMPIERPGSQRLLRGSWRTASAAGRLAARASLAAGAALTASALTGSLCQMLPTPPRVWSLAARTAGAGRTELLEALRRDGFVRVELSRAELSTLEEAVGEFGQARAFRYPPPPPDPDASFALAPDVPAVQIRMAPPFSRCFNTLYGILVVAAHSLLGTEHVAPPRRAASRLWLRATGPDDGARWVAPGSGQLLLWAGDGLELPGVEPVEHCVRVDPEGPYIEHSHSRPDPAAPPSGNRRSVALVLDE
ncbi:unnamed protein product [Prorocentrum cordatum]|uniref:Uncharacterized protein n=1 Tax=Prorocentrum cordatum TaxID=2364126 RepID=A0ABN9T7M8_9DINO|nr:unnamed protein product [Polarella glacialis]